MKVLVLTTLYPNNISRNHGIFIKNRVASVSNQSACEIKVVAPVPYFPPLKVFKKWYSYSQVCWHERIDGIDVYHPRYLVTPKIGMSLYGFFMFLGVLKVVRKIHREFPFDVIDAHYIFPDAFASVLLAKVFKKPVVSSARGSDINLYTKLPFVRQLLKFTLNHSTSVISVCCSIKEAIVKLGVDGEKVSVIPNGISKNNFYWIDKNQAKEKLSLPIDSKILISVGSLRVLKGHHLLIDAIYLLKKRGQLDFKTYIIGEGYYEGVLRDKIDEYGLREWVHLKGHVENCELVYWYNAADLFFLGSSREGWPNVITESLGCGTPVVATNVNGVPEIINSIEYGILVERNAEAFAQGIMEAIHKNWDYNKIYVYGQTRTWENVSHEVFGVLKKAIAGYC